jgi:hypothetical protein
LPPIPYAAKNQSKVADYNIELWIEADRYRKNIQAIKKTQDMNK